MLIYFQGRTRNALDSDQSIMYTPHALFYRLFLQSWSLISFSSYSRSASYTIPCDLIGRTRGDRRGDRRRDDRSDSGGDDCPVYTAYYSLSTLATKVAENGDKL